MFKVFQKSKEVIQNFTKSQVDTNTIIEEIHDSFNTAADKLLVEAREIISTTIEDIQCKLKEELGFIKAKGVQENKEALNKKKISEEIAKTIEYYQQTYPQYKFITLDKIEEICKKYGLVFGQESAYKGDIPSKNLQEIANFDKKLVEKDIIYQKRVHISGHELIEPKSITFEEYTLHCADRDRYNYYSVNDKFSICAPLKDMEVSNRQKVENGWTIIDIPDLVVLFPVRGGHLIISTWGKEGEDEEVVNQKMN